MSRDRCWATLPLRDGYRTSLEHPRSACFSAGVLVVELKRQAFTLGDRVVRLVFGSCGRPTRARVAGPRPVGRR